MVKRRRGASRLGCLVSLLLVVAVAYFGYNVGEVYFRYYQLRDAMEQEARFAQNRDDATVRSRLAAAADSLGLPEDATRFRITRDAHHITIETSYVERVELPMMVRELHFAPRVERAF